MPHQQMNYDEDYGNQVVIVTCLLVSLRSSKHDPALMPLGGLPCDTPSWGSSLSLYRNGTGELANQSRNKFQNLRGLAKYSPRDI